MNRLRGKKVMCRIWLWFRVYGGQFYLWRNLEYPEKIT